MNQQKFDVLVIGAGAAGLMAAMEISSAGRSVAVIEAKHYAGGRIQTAFTDHDYPMELGAEFIHGKLPISEEILQNANAGKYEVDGSIWQKKEGKLSQQKDFIEDYESLEKKLQEVTTDISVADFLKLYLEGKRYEKLRFTLSNYVEGYYAADITQASTFALRDELMKGDEEQYRMAGGYQKLVKYLHEKCVSNGVSFYFSQAVSQINWKDKEVEAKTAQTSFTAYKAIVTVSVGVLQQNGIHFNPALPDKLAAGKQLGFGHVVKVNLLFEDAFWKEDRYNGGKDLSQLNFLFSEEEIPTWWTQHPNDVPLLTGWLGGPKAAPLQALSKEQIVEKAIYSLSAILGINGQELKKKIKSVAYNPWSEDPHFFGAYSYAVINGEENMKRLLEPVSTTLYFAGEGLHHGKDIGTVEAALQSGRTVSHQLIADILKSDV